MVKRRNDFEDDESVSEVYIESFSESEEGEVSEASIEFDDGYDVNLMGDEEDIEMLNNMTEVEREKELFKRMERREALKARRLIEKRLKASKRNISEVTTEQIRPKRSQLSLLANKKADSINKLKEQRLKHKIKNDSELEINKSIQYE